MLKAFTPHYVKQDRRMMFVIGLVTLYEGIVLVLSLGFLNVDARAWVLFDHYGDL